MQCLPLQNENPILLSNISCTNNIFRTLFDINLGDIPGNIIRFESFINVS